MTTNDVVFEVLENTGLNWTLSKETIQTESGIVVPNKYAVVRSDNQKALGVVGNKYEFMQNHEMAHTIIDAGEGVFNKGAEFKHPWDNSESLGSFGNVGGGSLRGGKAVFLQLELPEKYIGKSDILRYITATNFHDGTGSLGFGTSNQVVCCENTFAMAHKTLSKFRHTASMQQRVDDAMINISNMLKEDEMQMEVFEAAANKAFDKHHVQDIVMSVFGLDVNQAKGDVSTRKINQASMLAKDIQTSIEEQGETLWALFNGVTRYTNHTTNSKDKDFGLMFGTEAKTNERAYKTMLGWLNMAEVAK